MKITRRQIRKIIKEHQADQQADNLLNEGFLDFLKKMGEAMIDAYKKQQAVTDEFKDSLDSQISKLASDNDAMGDKLNKYVESLSPKYLADAQSARKSLLKKIMADTEKLEDIAKADQQKMAINILSYVWSAASSE